MTGVATQSRTRILGIDPGSRFTGYGIIDCQGNYNRYVTSGCIKAGQVAGSRRLAVIFKGIQEIILEFQPQEIAIEKVFVHRNADSALKLGQARGAAICAVVAQSLEVSEYSATQIKQSVVGKGNAAKEQVQHMVKVLLNLPASPQADAADALAAALCHSNTRQTLQNMRSGMKVL